MKRIAFLTVLLLSMSATFAQGRVEFKWYGLYTVLDYSYAVNMGKDAPCLEGEEGSLSFSELTGIVGFQIRKETGVGLGFSYMIDPSEGYTQMPVYVELRSHYFRSRLTPFSVLKLGYTMPMGEFSGGEESININKGGVFLGVELGGRFAVTHGFAVSLHVGYQMIMMGEVEYVHDGLLAQRVPVQLHLVKAGLGINF